MHYSLGVLEPDTTPYKTGFAFARRLVFKKMGPARVHARLQVRCMQAWQAAHAMLVRHGRTPTNAGERMGHTVLDSCRSSPPLSPFAGSGLPALKSAALNPAWHGQHDHSTWGEVEQSMQLSIVPAFHPCYVGRALQTQPHKAAVVCQPCKGGETHHRAHRRRCQKVCERLSFWMHQARCKLHHSRGAVGRPACRKGKCNRIVTASKTTPTVRAC